MGNAMTRFQVYPATRTLEGAGCEVQRAIPTAHFGSVGPFIFGDHGLEIQAWFTRLQLSLGQH